MCMETLPFENIYDVIIIIQHVHLDWVDGPDSIVRNIIIKYYLVYLVFSRVPWLYAPLCLFVCLFVCLSVCNVDKDISGYILL